jgi:hypothetical protein
MSECTCPHCGKPINPAKMMGAIRTPKKEAAWKANGERLRKMYANARKVGESSIDPEDAEEENEKTVVADKSVHELLKTFDTPVKGIAPKGSFSLAQLKEMIKAPIERVEEAEETPLLDTPRAPFDFPGEDGGTCRVAQAGKRGLAVWFVGEEGQSYLRMLAPGELEKLWAKRIVK